MRTCESLIQAKFSAYSTSLYKLDMVDATKFKSKNFNENKVRGGIEYRGNDLGGLKNLRLRLCSLVGGKEVHLPSDIKRSKATNYRVVRKVRSMALVA